MDRRKFIKGTCMTCLGGGAIALLASSCTATSYIQGSLGKDGLNIPVREFETGSGEQKKYRPYIIIRNDALQYPICLYRFSEKNYSAVWMQCTHQGAELQVSGDRLQCTAHGSEFDSKGTVSNGPASRHLRNFPVTVFNDQLFIDLRAV